MRLMPSGLQEKPGRWPEYQAALTGVGEIRDGSAYANVHTTSFPGGEIRGQVRLVQ